MYRRVAHRLASAAASIPRRARATASALALRVPRSRRAAATATVAATAMAAAVAVARSDEPLWDPRSGVDVSWFDHAVPPQTSFYRHVNGRWLDETEIPAHYSDYSEFHRLAEVVEERVRDIVLEAADAPPPGADASEEERRLAMLRSKIGRAYNAFMDEEGVRERGLAALRDDLERVRAAESPADVLACFGRLNELGAGSPLGVYVAQDGKDSTRYRVHVTQGGLGLPDRDYYSADDEQHEQWRAQYRDHVARVFLRAGAASDEADAADRAARVFGLEQRLAAAQWPKARNRDRNATYNRTPREELDALLPAGELLRAAGVPDAHAGDDVIVRQPDYVREVAAALSDTPVEDLRLYAEFRLLSRASRFAFEDEHHAFYQKALRGVEKQQPRWKRAIQHLDGTLGDATGQLYAERHFPPGHRQRIGEMIENMMQAFQDNVGGLPWMTDDTKEAALRKLRAIKYKVGHPGEGEWVDYSALEVGDDLLANSLRSAEFESRRRMARLGGPIVRTEWPMLVHQVNACFLPSTLDIVFPAAILQPPFFFGDAEDPATSYGAIGAVILHEISHAVDDAGRLADERGELRTWWSAADEAAFNERADAVARQFGSYEPAETPGMHLDGRLTLGENIADLGGVSVAYKAYKRALGGRPAPVIGGYTGEQRFFLGWAQMWRRAYRQKEMVRRLRVDPHSPSEFRVDGVLRNMPEFHEAFGVREGDKMYLPEEERVAVW